MLWDVDLFSEIERLRREMNGLFSSYGKNAGAATYPLLNVYDGKDVIVVMAELPGLSKEKVTITFSGGVLTIAGKHKILEKVKNMTAVRKERSEGDFEKTLNIPSKIDQEAINASFKDGILTVTLPKAEEAKPKTISIEAK